MHPHAWNKKSIEISDQIEYKGSKVYSFRRNFMQFSPFFFHFFEWTFIPPPPTIVFLHNIYPCCSQQGNYSRWQSPKKHSRVRVETKLKARSIKFNWSKWLDGAQRVTGLLISPEQWTSANRTKEFKFNSKCLDCKSRYR